MATTVVIPAHNEEYLIGRCLESIIYAPKPVGLRVIVVCNGCSDGTAAVARAVEADCLSVYEIPQVSKISALNFGDEIAGDDFPRIYVDADVVFSPDGVFKIAALADTAAAISCAPSLRVDVSGRPWAVRRYYNAFLRSSWVRDGLIGSGVYAVSAAGWKRISPFPEVLNDDKWVYNHFSRAERLQSDGWFMIPAPLTLKALIRSKARVAAGERQLRTMSYVGGPLSECSRQLERGGTARAAKRWFSAPVSMVVWSAVRVLIRMSDIRSRLRGNELDWRRDSTTRSMW